MNQNIIFIDAIRIYASWTFHFGRLNGRQNIGSNLLISFWINWIFVALPNYWMWVALINKSVFYWDLIGLCVCVCVREGVKSIQSSSWIERKNVRITSVLKQNALTLELDGNDIELLTGKSCTQISLVRIYFNSSKCRFDGLK